MRISTTPRLWPFLALALLTLALLPVLLPALAPPPAAAQTAPPALASPGGVTVAATPRSPAQPASFQVTFTNGPQPLEPLQDAILMRVSEDLRVPPFVPPPEVQVRFQLTDGAGALLDSGHGFAATVELEGQADPTRDTTLAIYHRLDDAGDGEALRSIPPGAAVTVTFTKQAGLANPTEGGAHAWLVATRHGNRTTAFAPARHPESAVRQAFGQAEAQNGTAGPQPPGFDPAANGLLVDWEVQLSRESARRGDEITLIGRGYKNDTTVTFWRDANFNGQRDQGELALCQATVGRNDIGFCSFNVSNPPFRPGAGDCALTRDEGAADCNFINGADGRNHTATLALGPEVQAANSVAAADPVLELEPYVGARAGPGRHLRVQLTDFPAGRITAVDLGGVSLDPGQLSADRVPASGSLFFLADLPPGVRLGYQSLRVAVTGADGREREGRETLWVTAVATLRVLPEAPRANQRISLTGHGFTGGGQGEIVAVTIGGHTIDPARINGGEPALVDANGGWTAAVDLPLNRSVTQPGPRTLRVTDQYGWTATATVTIPQRRVTVTPPWSRPGTTVTVRGEGFPARNDYGSPFNLTISYEAAGGQTVAMAEATPDGSFEAELPVPSGASSPSTNRVRVSFLDEEGGRVTTYASHDVPGVTVTAAPAQGPPGTPVRLSGRGFRAYTPVTEVRVGQIEVTPAPLPVTDAQGRVALEVLIPGAGTGLLPLTLTVGQETASATLEVTRPGPAGATTPAAEGVASLGSRFVRLFHFDNDGKGWRFYDPAAGAASTQTHLAAGQAYWFLVTESAEAALNGRTRSLTCARGNCWNLVVW